MTRYEQLAAAAAEHGWTVTPESTDYVHTATFRRRNPDDRRKTEYLRVEFSIAETVKEATWAPRLDGLHARTALRDRFSWALRKLSRTSGN